MNSRRSSASRAARRARWSRPDHRTITVGCRRSTVDAAPARRIPDRHRWAGPQLPRAVCADGRRGSHPIPRDPRRLAPALPRHLGVAAKRLLVLLKPETVEQCRDVHARLPDAVTTAFIIPQFLAARERSPRLPTPQLTSLANRLLVHERYAVATPRWTRTDPRRPVGAELDRQRPAALRAAMRRRLPPASSSHLTRRWRGLDSNFQYAGAVNLVEALFCRRKSGRVGAPSQFSDSTSSTGGLARVPWRRPTTSLGQPVFAAKRGLPRGR
jgi:hypothetical protein